MGAKEETPRTHAPNVSIVQSNIDINVFRDKDTTISFDNPIRQKIYDLFLSGGQYSVVEISQALSIPDPRSHIRFIRNAGVPISDYWVRSRYIQYKVYFLHDGRKGGVL
jgi:hypothetical protein